CGISNYTAYIISSDLLNCRYKTGSYWILVDSVNNGVDSMYLTNFNQSFLIDNICHNQYETHSYTTVSYPTLQSSNYVVVQGGLFKEPNGINSGTLIYDDQSTSMTGTIIIRFDSLFIYDRYYHNVSQTTVENDPTQSHNKSVYYINSDFGFLRED